MHYSFTCNTRHSRLSTAGSSWITERHGRVGAQKGADIGGKQVTVDGQENVHDFPKVFKVAPQLMQISEISCVGACIFEGPVTLVNTYSHKSTHWNQCRIRRLHKSRWKLTGVSDTNKCPPARVRVVGCWSPKAAQKLVRLARGKRSFPHLTWHCLFHSELRSTFPWYRCLQAAVRVPGTKVLKVKI